MMVNKKILVKTPEQIEGIKKASILAANALQFAEKQIQIGISSDQLDTLIYHFIRDAGGFPASLGYMGFPASSCISVNEIVCHGIPDKRIFQNGDIVKVDIAVVLNGFFGDNCATFAIGEISEEAEKLIRVAKECLELGIAEVQPNAYLNNIAKSITKHARKHEYGVVFEYAGHGVGCQFHEPPSVSHAELRINGPKMLPGWVFTIEPMINVGTPKTLINEADGWTVRTADGKLSAQFEHTILVTENGNEILTIPTNRGQKNEGQR